MRCLVVILAAAALGACATGPRTVFDSTWEDPTYADSPFTRIALLANFRTESDSRQFEQEIAASLEERGIAAVQGHMFLDDGRAYSQEEMEARLHDVDAEGILISKLIAVDEERVYHPPAGYLRGMPPGMIRGNPYFWYYYPHWNYYSYWRSSFGVTRARGYWREHRYVIVETSLYDNRTNQLVWTGKSETMEPREFSALADSIARAVTRRLSELDLIDGGTAGAVAAAE